MPSHGDFNSIFGTAAAYSVADKLVLPTESNLEIVAWGFIQTVAGVWTTLPCTAKLEVRDAAGGNAVISGGKTMSYGGSPAVGSRLYVRPTLTAGAGSQPGALSVGPGKTVAVAVTQVGTATGGSGYPFIVFRRKSFHPDAEAGDFDVAV